MGGAPLGSPPLRSWGVLEIHAYHGVTGILTLSQPAVLAGLIGFRFSHPRRRT